MQAPEVLIAIRQSPQWSEITFDEFEKQCIGFSKLIGRDQDLLPRLVRLWNKTFSLSYFQVRQKMKEISQDNLASLVEARVITAKELTTNWVAKSIVCFVDDDDWFHPDIAKFLLVGHESYIDGYLWPHMVYGRQAGSALCIREDLNFCYTNNYAIAPRLLEEVGWQALEQHWLANTFLQNKNFHRLPFYLSMTNKHPASTVMLESVEKENLDSPGLINLVRDYVARTKMVCAEPKLESSWAIKYMKEVEKLFSELVEKHA